MSLNGGSTNIEDVDATDPHALKAALIESEIIVDNLVLAGRMPPDDTAYMHPLEMAGIYGPSELTAKLADALPKAPEAAQAFNMKAPDQTILPELNGPEGPKVG